MFAFARLHTAIIVSAALLCLLATPRAFAQQADDTTAAAEALFEQGRQLMDAGQFAEACEKFAASNEADASVGALLNLGACQERIGRLASAWTSYRQAATLARRDKDRRRANFASKRAAELEQQLSYLVIEVPDDSNAEGLRVLRDGNEVPAALWNQRIPVDPGEFSVVVEAPGYRAWTTQVSIAPRAGGGSEVTRVSVPALEAAPHDLPEGSTQAPQTARPGQAPAAAVDGSAANDEGLASDMGTGRWLALANGAIGVAAVAGGVTLALQSQSKQDEAFDSGFCNQDNVCDERGVALIDDSRSSAQLSYIFYGVGAAALTAGVVLWILSDPAESDAPAFQVGETAQLRSIVGPDVVGLELTGSF